MQTLVTEREKQKAMETGILRSTDETFLMRKKEIAIIKIELINYKEINHYKRRSKP